LIGVFGLRYDRVSSDTAGAPLQIDKATSGRAALMYELPFGITPYVSYAQSFNPIFGATTCVDFCKPQRGEQYEVGFKYSQTKDLTINGALFDTTEKNRTAADPAGSGRSIQTGKVRIRGAELEVLATVASDLDLIGAYTYLDTEVLSGDDMGKRIETVPEHQASLWAKYRFAMFGVQGFSVGGGVRYIGPVWDGTDTIQTPGYALVDAMIGWENQNWRFQINGTNLADNIHLASCLARGDCFYGSRRTILSSLTYKF
jgi:iron complex outermembrane receptor protein